MSIEKKELDMTRGEPGKLLLMFMMPLLGTYILQQMYTLADTIIVGYVMVPLFGEQSIFAAEPAAWILAALYAIPSFYIIQAKKMRNTRRN